jgi:tripartite-type tricarboxylate transporter receptor subunit TctC
MQKLQRWIGCAAISVAVLPGPAQAQADDYPAKPVQMIIGFTPGGSTDLEARLYSDHLGEQLKRPFIMDYRPGAGGTIANGYVAKAVPDGYTLLPTTSSFMITPAFYDKLPYDTPGDFAPISQLSSRATVILVHRSFPAKSLSEYIAYAKANPEKVNWGTVGAGGVTHLAGALLHNITDSKVTFVHYKGSAPLFADMVAGRLDVSVTTFATAGPFLKSGKLRPLAVTSAVRSKAFPDLPTAAEQGAPGYDFSSVLGMGLVAPRGTPAPIVNKLNAELVKIVRNPAVTSKLEGDGTVMVGNTPEQFRQSLAAEVARWKKVVSEAGIKLQ